jgi:hypothetical protein
MPEITPHPTWDILDSSKIQEYMDCPRKYFYKYILGWRLDVPQQALVFGECWHAAMDTLYEIGFTETGIEAAKERFEQLYRLEFGQETDDLYHPKSVWNAFEAIELYALLYARWMLDYEVVEIEVAGSVPINEDQRLHFRMDKILRHKKTRKYYAIEHKTTGRGGRQWNDQWVLSTQVGTYTHTLYCLYPIENVYGVIVDGVIFTKKDIKFERVPCERMPEQMSVWLQNTQDWVEEILGDTYKIRWCCEDNYKNEPLDCFMMNTQNCTKYWGCEFHDFCISWTNPLLHADEVPIGFKQEFWNPIEHTEKLARKIVELYKKGA